MLRRRAKARILVQDRVRAAGQVSVSSVTRVNDVTNPQLTVPSASASDEQETARGVSFALLIVMLALMTLLGGCGSTRGGTIPYDVQNFGVPDAPAALTVEEDYKIAPLDTLKITVFQVPDLSGEFLVDLTGNIALPLVGNVKAVDKTAAQLQVDLVRQLGAKYLKSPDVSVGVKSSGARNVTLDGAVRQPGLYPVNGPLTLIQAVAMARGTDENSNPRRVAIFRQVSGQRMAAAFDLTSIRRGEMDDPKIFAGDIIVVDGSNVRALQREILTALPIVGFFRPF